MTVPRRRRRREDGSCVIVTCPLEIMLVGHASMAVIKESILPFYAQAGVDIANFDFCVAPLDVRLALPQTYQDGNIKSVERCQTASRLSAILPLAFNWLNSTARINPRASLILGSEIR